MWSVPSLKVAERYCCSLRRTTEFSPLRAVRPDCLCYTVLATDPGNSTRATGDRLSLLITDEQRSLLLVNDHESLENSNFDPALVVKLFTPDGRRLAAGRD